MEQKGGVGSGIRGHRTIRDAILGMGSKEKTALLLLLKEELAKRLGDIPNKIDIAHYKKLDDKQRNQIEKELRKQWQANSRRQDFAIGMMNDDIPKMLMRNKNNEIVACSSYYKKGKDLYLNV